MKKSIIFLAFIGFSFFVIGFIAQYNKTKCRVDDGVYLVKEVGDIERAIMLPGTQLGFTIQEMKVDADGKVKTVGEKATIEFKAGHPSAPEDVDDDYIKNVQIAEAHQVSDGNYVVKRGFPDEEPMWTVWTKELYQKVKEP